MKKGYFIHPFSLVDKYYFYDVNTNRVIKCSKEQFDYFNSISHSEDEFTNNFTKMGFLQENRVENIEHSASKLMDYYLNSKIRSMTLQVTQKCNFRCEYCAYSGDYNNRTHDNKDMDIDLAKKCIDFFILHSRECNVRNIGFYGGEPLLKLDMIRECIEYAESISEGKELSFSITTNGSLLNNETAEYFEKHNVSLTISLDGPREIHDNHRKFINGNGTYDVIIENLENIKHNVPQYFNKIMFNIVLDPGNNFNCVKDYFINYDLFKNSVKNLSLINDNYSKKKIEYSEDYIIQRRYEIFKIFLFKLNRLGKNEITDLYMDYFLRLQKVMHNDRKPTSTLPPNLHPGGPCIVGADKLFVNTNGDFYPCERVSESSKMMKIGNINTGFEIDKVKEILNIGKITKEKCINCWAFRFCFLCAAFADNLDSFSAELKTKHCQTVKGTAEEMLNDYCTLKEFGYNFSNNLNFNSEVI